MNENELFDEEDLLEDEALIDDDSSSNNGDTLEQKLDRVEALLNEDIALRTSENNEDLVEDQVEEVVTGSGAVPDPDYSQYIYDLLTDSTVQVELVQQESDNIFDKQLNDYTVTETMMVLGLVIAFSVISTHFIEIHDLPGRASFSKSDLTFLAVVGPE